MQNISSTVTSENISKNLALLKSVLRCLKNACKNLSLRAEKQDLTLEQIKMKTQIVKQNSKEFSFKQINVDSRTNTMLVICIVVVILSFIF